MPHILAEFLKKPSAEKIFIAIIFAAIAVRLFAIAYMPDPQLTDTVYHLEITRFIAGQHRLPLPGEIPGISALPVPLYYFTAALPFALLPIPFNLVTVKIFPFVFSALQLLLSFFLLRRLFPKNYLPGLAFVAVHPLLVIYGSVNYVETFASVCVLLCFFVYLRFAQTKKKIFLLAMPFALAAAALSKLSATIVVPAFFAMFLWEILKGGKTSGKKMPCGIAGPAGNKTAAVAYFVFASLLLCSAWFAVDFLRNGSFFGVSEVDLENISGAPSRFSLSIGTLSLPLLFNEAFWFLPASVFDALPFGSANAALPAAFDLLTLPLLLFVFYGMLKGAARKDRPSILLLLCLLLASLLFLARYRFFYSRLLLPIMPLFAIAFANAFGFAKSGLVKKAVFALFCVFAVYGIAFSAAYVMHYKGDFDRHAPLFAEIERLPAGSSVAIHANKARQLSFIYGTMTVACAEERWLEGTGAINCASADGKIAMQSPSAQQLLGGLRQLGATHLADICYKNIWGNGVIRQLSAEGGISKIYSDQCSTLYKIE